MISGRQALATVEQAIVNARNKEGRLDAALRSASDEAARLRGERMDAFRELARVKLDALHREEVIGEIDAVERRALALIEEGRRAFEVLTKRRRQAEQAAQAAEAERHARAADYEQALEAVHGLRNRIEADALVSSEWAQQRTRIDQLARIASEADKKAAQAEAHREQKRKPYDADPLFRYLWERHFGSPQYAAGSLVRFLDGRVARLVGYDKARANYALLNEIPARLREHATRIKGELENEQARLKAIERAALVNAGVEPLEAKATELKSALDEAEHKLAETRAALDASDRQHDSSVLEEEAVELLARADAAQDLQALYREATLTPSPKDEAILKRIEETEMALGRVEQEIGTIRREMRELAGRRAQIERERDEFRRRGYDNPYGTFGNEQVLTSVLSGILGGILQATVLRDVIRQGYRQRSGPWDSDFGGGEGLPSPEDRGAGGRNARDRDQFTTGGSF
jgi:hypothetical protein